MPHLYVSSREKRIDLWAGFAGWIALAAGALVVAAFAAQVALGMIIFATAAAALALGLTRPYAAFGWLLGAAAVLALLVVELPFFLLSLPIDVALGVPRDGYCSGGAAICTGPPATSIALLAGLVTFLIAAWFSLRGIDRRVR